MPQHHPFLPLLTLQPYSYTHMLHSSSFVSYPLVSSASIFLTLLLFSKAYLNHNYTPVTVRGIPVYLIPQHTLYFSGFLLFPLPVTCHISTASLYPISRLTSYPHNPSSLSPLPPCPSGHPSFPSRRPAAHRLAASPTKPNFWIWLSLLFVWRGRRGTSRRTALFCTKISLVPHGKSGIQLTPGGPCNTSSPGENTLFVRCE